jgi:transposase
MNICVNTSRLYQSEAGRYAVIIVDGAASHQPYLAVVFANLSIIKLPVCSPELNTIEQLWQWPRQNKLANRCFEGYEDIVEQCSRAWINFISDSQRIASLYSRDWIEVGLIMVIGISYRIYT